MSLKAGSMKRQGPHQVAEKSITICRASSRQPTHAQIQTRTRGRGRSDWGTARAELTSLLGLLLWAPHCSSQVAVEWTATTRESPPSSAAGGGVNIVEKKEPISVACLVWFSLSLFSRLAPLRFAWAQATTLLVGFWLVMREERRLFVVLWSHLLLLATENLTPNFTINGPD